MAENNTYHVRDVISEYLEKHKTEQHRYKSWEHCYNHFQMNVIGKEDNIEDDKDYAALMLGFYLASWGMYRGSSKLLTDYTYTIHKGAIEILKEDKKLKECCEELKKYYEGKGVSPTDTLISKIILGTHGTLPAFDDYFCKGVKKCGISLSSKQTLAEKYDNIKEILKNNSVSAKLDEFEQIAENQGLPVAKIIDMYFWTLGNPKTKENRHKEMINIY